MRIECPHCQANGNINDMDIPDDGMYLSCPRCKQSFQVSKPRKKMTSPFATNTCPACGFSTCCEEVFDECPKCGIVVKTLVEKKQQEESWRRDDEVLSRNSHAPLPAQALPTAPVSSKYSRQTPDTETSRITLAGFANGFDPVAAIGWGAGLLAVVLLLFGLFGVFSYNGTTIQEQLSAQSVEPVSAWAVFWGYGFLPWVETLYGGSVLVTAFGFLQREQWGGKAMHVVLTTSLVLAPLYELVNYIIWIVKSISPPWWAYLVEFLSALLFAALWVVPLFLLLRYLQGERFKRSYADKI